MIGAVAGQRAAVGGDRQLKSRPVNASANPGAFRRTFAVSTSGYSNPSQTPSGQQSTGSIDEDAVARAKQEIQTLVQEVVELSRSEADPTEFYSALMDKSVTALAAIGGVVWTQEEGAPLKLEY